MNRKALAALLLLVSVAGANAFVAHHAWVMTHFDPLAQAPVPPEKQILAQRVRSVLWGVRLPRARNESTPAAFGLRYETHAIAGSEGRELESWYVPAKRARGIAVFFHGFGKAKDSQLGSAKIMHDLGYDCLLVDFYGYGGSKGDSSTIGWTEALDVATATAHARKLAGKKPVVLIGSSMGAAAILRATALELASADALVLEAPYLRFVDSVRRRFELMSFPVTTPFAEWITLWGGILNGFNTFTMNPVEWAHQVKTPTLLLFGERDRTITRAEGEELFTALSGPRFRREFAGLGHGSYSTNAPDEWRDEVGGFLASLPK